MQIQELIQATKSIQANPGMFDMDTYEHVDNYGHVCFRCILGWALWHKFGEVEPREATYSEAVANLLELDRKVANSLVYREDWLKLFPKVPAHLGAKLRERLDIMYHNEPAKVVRLVVSQFIRLHGTPDNVAVYLDATKP
jgi:hypothetical protein